jgi:hypothetical protein
MSMWVEMGMYSAYAPITRRIDEQIHLFVLDGWREGVRGTHTTIS